MKRRQYNHHPWKKMEEASYAWSATEEQLASDRGHSGERKDEQQQTRYSQSQFGGWELAPERAV